MRPTSRAHVVMPRELIRQVDELAGGRNRSRFVAEAVAEKLDRVRRLRSLQQSIGFLAEGDVPEWDTAESSREWVRALRQEADRFPAGQAWG